MGYLICVPSHPPTPYSGHTQKPNSLDDVWETPKTEGR